MMKRTLVTNEKEQLSEKGIRSEGNTRNMARKLNIARRRRRVNLRVTRRVKTKAVRTVSRMRAMESQARGTKSEKDDVIVESTVGEAESTGVAKRERSDQGTRRSESTRRRDDEEEVETGNVKKAWINFWNHNQHG